MQMRATFAWRWEFEKQENLTDEIGNDLERSIVREKCQNYAPYQYHNVLLTAHVSKTEASLLANEPDRPVPTMRSSIAANMFITFERSYLSAKHSQFLQKEFLLQLRKAYWSSGWTTRI